MCLVSRGRVVYVCSGWEPLPIPLTRIHSALHRGLPPLLTVAGLPLWLCMGACCDVPRAPPANSECATHHIDATTRDQGHCRSFSRYIPAGNATERDIRVSIELQDLQCYMYCLRLRTMLRVCMLRTHASPLTANRCNMCAI